MGKVKKNDTVQIIKGKDRGKKGRVLCILLAGQKALVEGLNLVKKHKRRTQQDQQGGLISIEAPVSIANLMLVCKQCNRPVRTGFKVQNDGTKFRYCKSCKGIL